VEGPILEMMTSKHVWIAYENKARGDAPLDQLLEELSRELGRTTGRICYYVLCKELFPGRPFVICSQFWNGCLC
jgi:hypothetical protein